MGDEDEMDVEEEGGWMEVRETIEKRKKPEVRNSHQL